MADRWSTLEAKIKSMCDCKDCRKEGTARKNWRALLAAAREGERLRGAMEEIEERTRPAGDMANAAVNEVARAALAGKGAP